MNDTGPSPCRDCCEPGGISSQFAYYAGTYENMQFSATEPRRAVLYMPFGCVVGVFSSCVSLLQGGENADNAGDNGASWMVNDKARVTVKC